MTTHNFKFARLQEKKALSKLKNQRKRERIRRGKSVRAFHKECSILELLYGEDRSNW